ncbi:MAG: anti-sigma factor [Thermoanaerobaculia bacterium]
MTDLRAVGQEDLIVELLGQLEGEERESIDALAALDPAERERLLRLDAELLGSLALALEPAAPRPGAREELLAAAVTGRQATVAPFVARGGTASPRAGWSLPLAATLAALGLGLAGLFFGQLQSEKRTVAQLEAQLAQARVSSGEVAAMREDMREAKRQLALVGTRGVEVCTLRPREAADAAQEEGPWGVLYVAPDHQHWYLAVRGLEPSPDGHAYQLWFMAEGRAVSGGTFSVEAGGPVELSSESMPDGTSAVMVTLEREDGPAEPNGPEILFGDGASAIRVL